MSLIDTTSVYKHARRFIWWAFFSQNLRLKITFKDIDIYIIFITQLLRKNLIY